MDRVVGPTSLQQYKGMMQPLQFQKHYKNKNFLVVPTIK